MTRNPSIPVSPSTKADTIAKTLAMGRSHHGAGNINAAEKCYRQVLALDPENVDGLHLLGVIAFQSDHVEEGIKLIKRAAKKRPKEPSILVNLGAAYRKAKQNAEARDAYKAAIKLKPDLWEAYFNLGKALLDLEDHKGAIAAYEKCLAMKPEDAEALVNLGNVYKAMGDGDAALALYERVLQHSANTVEAYANIAAVFLERNNFHAALAVMDKGLDIDPQSDDLRFKRSIIALRLENFSTGWLDYESRYYADIERVALLPPPPVRWAGEDLTGKTLLIRTEQGIGDEILYGSMIPDVVARAARCIVEVTPRMVPVFARSFPNAVVSSCAQPELSASDADYQVQLPSLGRFFRPALSKFPIHGGYLQADPGRTAELRARYKAIRPGNIVVGISWRSKSERVGGKKSAAISDWSHLLKVPGVTFVNLQYGNCDDELAKIERTLGIHVYQDREIDPLSNMDDFFCQVAAIDLVITVSNTTAHVAGSLNIPTWLLLSTGAASLWYWFLDRDRSPWYPSVQIFRNPVGEGVEDQQLWSAAAARIGQKLDALVKSCDARNLTTAINPP